MMLNRSMSRALAVAAGSLVSLTSAAAWAQDADLSLNRITLYRSGVGYFEMRGKVQDNADVSMQFDAGQINDILKTMVLLDLSGGQVDAVQFDSNEPLERRLASFGLDISDNPEIATIFERLRGEPVKIVTADGPITGPVVSVETREVAAGDRAVTTQWFVNVLDGKGLRSVAVRDVRSFEILNPALAEELNLALAALAQQRDTDTQRVDLRFRGAGVRDVLVGYVHETPVWKASYRLVLPEDTAGAPATMQGWAIVENTTDEDWKDVKLSLVSGRPVSFTMNLAQPLFLDRPDVPVPVEVAAAPRAYERGTAPARKAGAGGGGESYFSIEDDDNAERAEMRYRALPAPAAVLAEAYADYAPAAQASAEEIGEVFQFTLDAPVTIERKRSAMLPIVTAPVAARRVSIFSWGQAGEHPMRGVEITNESGLQLMPGPIAVYDGAAYAGDATIRHIAAGDSRLLSYALDLDVTVRSDGEVRERVNRVNIQDGSLLQQTAQEWRIGMTLSNADVKRERTVVVEVPRDPAWELMPGVTPTEETATTLRFEVTVPAKGESALRVDRQRVTTTTIGISDYDLGTLVSLQREGRASQGVLNAVQKARGLVAEVGEAIRARDALIQERSDITGEQARIRQNMQSIERTSELYTRYLQKLDEQETRFEQLGVEIAKAEQHVQARQAVVREFLGGLSVE